MLITFSGLDGSGKSTLIAGLKQALEQRNKRVAVFHMYYDVGLLAGLRYIWKKVGGEKEKLSEKSEAHSPREPADDGRTATLLSRVRYMIGWNKSLRLFIYPFDLLIFLFYRLYIEKVRRQILIMDRYFYDTLVDVAEGRRWYGVRVLSRLTPTPSLPVLVDISPEEAFSRKGEHSVAYLSRRRLSYQKLFPKGEGAIVLAGGDDINDTRRRLEKIVMERLAA
jgi:thymidylate kinase